LSRHARREYDRWRKIHPPRYVQFAPGFWEQAQRDVKDLIEACGYNPGHYAKAYGQAISLLDATCLLLDLPWLGRLVVFKNAKDGLPGPWAPWRVHMPEIVGAPLKKRWSADELNRISAAVAGCDAWWRA
jgi:hypothetical protein